MGQMTLVRRRLRRLGAGTVLGQVLFRSFVVPWLTFKGRARVAEIKRQFNLDDRPMEGVRRVASMNDEDARAVLRGLQPAVTLVCGTRILDRATLGDLNGPVVNFHAGITPAYRGVHGGYWALVEGRPDLVGSTLHLIDPGIDTGEVVSQVTFDVTTQDSFATYPYLHVAAVLRPIEDVVRQALAGEPVTGRPHQPGLESRLRTHPTLWEYVKHARAGVR